MANGAVGELLTQLTRSFQQGRDFNLQAANARASATLRIQQFQLEKERKELDEERIRQSISASQTEQKIREFGLTEEIKAGRRSRELEKIVAAGQTVPTSEEGRPFAAFEQGPLSDERRATALEELDRPVSAKLAARVEEGALTPVERGARKLEEEVTRAGLAKTRAETERIRRGVGGGATTQTERDRVKWLHPDTSDAERNLLEQSLFGGKMMINGIPNAEIRATINSLFPVNRYGERTGVPDDVNPNSYEFLEFVAQLLKGDDGSAPDVIPTEDDRIKKVEEKGFLNAE